MIHPYLTEFKAVVFAENQTDAMARVRYWRSLAAAAGWQPGPGRVSSMSENELPADLAEQLERARAKDGGAASEWQRERAVRALASNLGGELQVAEGIVARILDAAGDQAGVAEAIAGCLVPEEAPSV